MNAKKKNLLLILLAALTVTTNVLASCSDTAKSSDNTASENESAIAEVTESETEEQIETDSLPELNFEGEKVRMAGQAVASNIPCDLWVEQTGDVVNDTIYNRNLAIEDRFNVVIEEPYYAWYEDVSKVIKEMVHADDDEYMIVGNQLSMSSYDAQDGIFMNLNDVPYLDFSRSWYPSSVVESATLNDKLYLIVSDMCTSYVGQTWTICFNKELAAQYNIEDLYTVTRDGKWTIDKLREVTINLYSDVNGDGQRDVDDQYGFTLGPRFTGCFSAAFLYGAGQRFIDIDEDYNVVHLLGSERALSLAEKISDLLNSPGTTNADTGEEPFYALNSMMRGRAVFVPSELIHYYTFARDFNGTYGILPMPKYDEYQENYISISDAGCNCITVPVTCQNTDLAGVMIEALSAYSHNYVIPVFIDTALQTKVARDEESVEMMNLILDSRIMDFGYLYCGWFGWTWDIEPLYKDVGTYMSTFESCSSKQTVYYNKIIKQFTKD